MGRRNSRKKIVPILDDDDTASLCSLSLAMPSDLMELYSVKEELLIDTESLLDRYLDALYEKRGSTREKGLTDIIKEFKSSLQHEFAGKKFATLLHQCLNSIKKGSAREVALAAHAIGLLALTTGPGEKAQEILRESVSPISEALKTRFEMSKTSSLIECFAVITFVAGETDKSMQIMWQLAHPELCSDVIAAKPSPAMVAMAISAWSFLLTDVDRWSLNPKIWQESMSYFSTLLDENDRLLRIAAGEAVALIFEIGSLEKFCGEPELANDIITDKGIDSEYIHELRSKIVNQVRDLSSEAGGKGSTKKDLNAQRNKFRAILDFIEDGYTPETSMKIGRASLHTTTWSQSIQLNFLKHFLGGGFVYHMQENEFLQDVFGFTPKKNLPGERRCMSSHEKRMYKSPNSAINKARTKILKEQRTLSQDLKSGHYAVGHGDNY